MNAAVFCPRPLLWGRTFCGGKEPYCFTAKILLLLAAFQNAPFLNLKKLEMLVYFSSSAKFIHAQVGEELEIIH